jgi:hypothetical protein
LTGPVPQEDPDQHDGADGIREAEDGFHDYRAPPDTVRRERQSAFRDDFESVTQKTVTVASYVHLWHADPDNFVSCQFLCTPAVARNGGTAISCRRRG